MTLPGSRTVPIEPGDTTGTSRTPVASRQDLPLISMSLLWSSSGFHLLGGEFLDFVHCVEMAEVEEVELVLDREALAVLSERHPDWLDHLLELRQPRRGLVRTVAKPVHHKGPIVGVIAKVAPVPVEPLPILLRRQSVVRPLPDEPPLKPPVRAERFLVIFQPTRAVSHGMRVLAQYDGLLKGPVVVAALFLRQLN